LKRKASALILISVLLLSVLAGTWFVSLTEAFQPEIKYETPPIISILSPVNYETFSSNTVPLSFRVTKPDNWLIHGGYAAQQILKSINYQLDGKHSAHIPVNSTLDSPFDCSLNLTNLTDGVHSLKVFAYASGWVIHLSGFYEYEVPINSSSVTIYFTVIGESSPEPTLTPPNRGPTSPPSEQPLLTQEQSIILGLAIIVAVLAVGLSLLLYRIKRK
jgi:hypothetical protein